MWVLHSLICSAFDVLLAFHLFTHCTELSPFLSSVFPVRYSARLSPHSMANTSRLDNAQPGFYDDLPAAAQRVPRSTLLHTILFKRISFPLTSRLDELWVIEVDQTGHETWSSSEEFICRFCPPVDPHVLQPWAASWREHFDIPAPVSCSSPTKSCSSTSGSPSILDP